MKVLKEGKWNVPWSDKFTCSTCEAQLLVEEADVKPYDYHNSGFTFTCPLCGKLNTLSDKDLPQRVREEKNRHRKFSGYDPRD